MVICRLFSVMEPFLGVQRFQPESTFRFSKNQLVLSLRGGRIFAPDAAIFDGARRHPGTKHGQGCAVKFALRASERCFACEMRACGRVKRRFWRSAAAVSLRDRFEYFDYKNGRFSRKTCRFCVSARLPPCFVPGFHTFDFKIATAALRPRNDTKGKGACRKTDAFYYI